MSHENEPQVRRTNARVIIPDHQDKTDLGPVIGYAQEPLLPLIQACIPLIPVVYNILIYADIALKKTPDNPPDGLTRDESASICLYTMEWNDEHKSLYSVLNKTLWTAERDVLQPWFKYLKLFLTALVKLPCAPPQTIWRGVHKNVSHRFPPASQVTWWAFSSCTTTLNVLESDMFLGKEGTRTLFSIEAINARNVRSHSFETDSAEHDTTRTSVRRYAI